MSDDEDSGLRAKKKAAVYKHLTDAAFRLFGECGFERTTIDDLAKGAGVSPRTFFRYFESKEDVVLGWLLRLGDELAANVATRPKSEAPWTALKHAAHDAIAPHTGDRAQTLRLLRLLSDTPSLRARHLEKQAAWQQAIAVEVAKRMGVDPKRAIEPRLYASQALAVLQLATESWAARGGKGDLAEVVAETFARVHVRVDDGA
ncbi:MAG: TetR family transcriptional regulator [Polyangiales bacterium]